MGYYEAYMLRCMPRRFHAANAKVTYLHCLQVSHLLITAPLIPLELLGPSDDLDLAPPLPLPGAVPALVITVMMRGEYVAQSGPLLLLDLADNSP